MDLAKKTIKELQALCKEKGIKGYSGKKKEDLLNLLGQETESSSNVVHESSSSSITQEQGQIQRHVQEHTYPKEQEKPYLQEFLKNLRSPKGFKRLTPSPLRYPGGKSKAIGIILDLLPALPQKRIVSPFFGGGSFEIAVAQNLGFEVIGYDIFGVLTNFWQQILQNPTSLADELAKLKAQEPDYTRNRHILLHYWEQIKPADLVYKTKNRLSLTDEEEQRLVNSPLLQAAYYYYNMQLSYGPMFLGWPSSVYLNEEKYKDIVERVRHFTIGQGSLQVNQASFEEAIQKHPDDFLFVDPPYYLGEDSKMFKGMYPNCNFAIHHEGFPHERLATLLKQHRGGFLLTYNDCPTIRENYKEYIQLFPKWHYSYGQGETRIGKNREEGTKDNKKESHELFIIKLPG